MTLPNIFCSILEIADPDERKEEILCAIFCYAMTVYLETDSGACYGITKSRLYYSKDDNERNWFRQLIHYSHNRPIEQASAATFQQYPYDKSSIFYRIKHDDYYANSSYEELLNLKDGERKSVVDLIQSSLYRLSSNFDHPDSTSLFSYVQNNEALNLHRRINSLYQSIILNFDGLFLFYFEGFYFHKKIDIVRAIAFLNRDILNNERWKYILKDLFSETLRSFIAISNPYGYGFASWQDTSLLYPLLSQDIILGTTVSDLVLKAYEKSLSKASSWDDFVVPVLLEIVRNHFPNFYHNYHKKVMIDGGGKYFSRLFFYLDLISQDKFDDELFKKLKKESSEQIWSRVADKVYSDGYGFLHLNIDFWLTALSKAKHEDITRKIVKRIPFELLPFLIRTKNKKAQYYIENRISKA